MRFYQHVYGRVAKGYRTNYSAYQIAALTDTLSNRRELVDQLNRCSFYRYEGPNGTPRYSFYSPADGYLAFGCSRLVKDRTGAIGSFAHHFVCEEEEFIGSSESPPVVLQTLPFVSSEEMLPESRSLPSFDYESPEAGSNPEWREFALDLLDVYLGESALVVPMVVLDLDQTWRLLGEVFSMLPRLEAARLTFSTMFVNAPETLDRFRMAFIPDRSVLQRDVQLYRILEPGENHVFQGKARPSPLTNFLRTTPPEAARKGTRLMNLLRHRPQNTEECLALFQDLLEYAALLRPAFESRRVPRVYSLVVRTVGSMVGWQQAGSALSHESVRKAVWEHPDGGLVTALQGAGRLGDQTLVASLLEDVARNVASGSSDTALLSDLFDAKFLDHFYRIACDRLDIRTLEYLGERLLSDARYTGQCHRAIASRVLGTIAEGKLNAIAETERWLSEQARALNDGFVQATAAIVYCASRRRKGIGELRLVDYSLQRLEEYQSILAAVWVLGESISESDWIRIVYRPDYADALFRFVAARILDLDPSGRRRLLQAIATVLSPVGRANDLLIDAIRATDEPYDLARYYEKLLKDSRQPDIAAVARLATIRPPKTRRFWE